ncbi:alanine racemase [Arachidicoccus soli]|uniref:Alanine racemase n=1 Tax=Arachidicoccus soli TaxID=2341117 RepID=A0A386HRV4_9BACT|nr:alanine racemase [Arachidicoccus soli]AYD48379.1 alanine racemase [Arachidicoccus soli]
MENTSNIYLDKKALAYNIDFLRKEMGEDVLISSVVKGNAYGHGIETYVPLAEASGIRHFSVFSAEEAIKVKGCLKGDIPIMIMGFLSEAQLEWAIENEVEFFIFDFKRLRHAIHHAKLLGKKALFHLELETGMNRTGFDYATLKKEVFPFLKENTTSFVFKGICTHFAGAESISNYLRIEEQKKVFLKLRNAVLKAGFEPEYTHTCCSAATIRLPKMRFNMVRIGILQYGLWPSPEIKIEYLRRKKLQAFNLKRVLTWKSELMSIKDVKMGEFIGYGNNYQTSENKRIGIIPVGYANGYSRVLSNIGRVLINDIRTAVFGNVNMNSLAIDLSNAPEAKVGDEVILIGEKGEHEISVASFGELSNQLNYELLTRLPMDIPRLVECS